MDVQALLRSGIEQKASDVHLKVGNPPIIRIDGRLVRDGSDPLNPDIMEEVLKQVMTQRDLDVFTKNREADFKFDIPNVARFRVNASYEEGNVRIVFRVIPVEVFTIKDLQLPDTLLDICKHPNGLVLVTGPTGSGKSTTLAAMINEINETQPKHIVTIEDPIEFVHFDKTAVISQRQVGIDTLSFANALRASLRQDPDVILIGEIRDSETMATAMSCAETGHLVFSTLHTVNAVETLDRIMDLFPPHQQEQVRKQIANILRAIISMRLVPRKEGKGRRAALEVLIGTATVREFILKSLPFRDIVKLMEEGKSIYGMQTFDQALYDLWREGEISEEMALETATTPKDLKLRFKGLTVG